MRFMILLTTILTFIGGAALAQNETTAAAEETAPVVSFDLAAGYSIPAFKPLNLDEATSALAESLCEDAESEACAGAKSAIASSKAAQLEQMLTAQTTIERGQLATMIALAAMQRDDARVLAARSANVLAEVEAFGTQSAAKAAAILATELAQAAQDAAAANVLLQQTTGEVVSAEELTAIQGQLALVGADLANAQATAEAGATVMRLLALDLLFVCNDNIPEADNRCEPYEGQLSSQEVIDAVRAEAGFSATDERNEGLQRLLDGATVTN